MSVQDESPLAKAKTMNELLEKIINFLLRRMTVDKAISLFDRAAQDLDAAANREVAKAAKAKAAAERATKRAELAHAESERANRIATKVRALTD